MALCPCSRRLSAQARLSTRTRLSRGSEPGRRSSPRRTVLFCGGSPGHSPTCQSTSHYSHWYPARIPNLSRLGRRTAVATAGDFGLPSRSLNRRPRSESGTRSQCRWPSLPAGLRADPCQSPCPWPTVLGARDLYLCLF